jgi:hypothetical protein
MFCILAAEGGGRMEVAEFPKAFGLVVETHQT